MNVIIIGGGQVGSYIANLLYSNNCSVKLIENRDNVLVKLKKELPPDIVVAGSGTDPNVLEACGIAKADVVAVVTGSDESNLVAATIAKFEFGVARVVARVNNPKNAWLFTTEMGVDVGLNQADLMAHIVVEEMDLNNMLTLMEINLGNYAIVEVAVDDKSNAVNKEVKDLDIPEKAVLIAIYRNHEVVIPHGNTVITGGDKILAFADVRAKVLLNNLFGSQK